MRRLARKDSVQTGNTGRREPSRRVQRRAGKFQKLRLHLALIKALLSTENCYLPTGWFVAGCGPAVTAFYEKAV
jgi:hypothetical protein